MAIQSISSAMGYAVYGIRGTIQRFESAVSNVVRSGAAMSDSTQFSSEALAKAKGNQAPETSLAQGLIDQRLALPELKANLSVIRTADEMDETLVNLGAPPRR